MIVCAMWSSCVYKWFRVHIEYSCSDPLLSGSPDYHKLAPSPSLKRRRIKLDQSLGKKRSSREETVDEDAAMDELRMCSTCQWLVDRRLTQLVAQETSILEALYSKMQLVMTEAGLHQPLYLEMVNSLL